MARCRFQPTDEQRQTVKALAGYGLPHQQIATVASVGSVTTLRKYFHEELTLGPLEARSNVARTLFRMATSSRHPGGDDVLVENPGPLERAVQNRGTGSA